MTFETEQAAGGRALPPSPSTTPHTEQVHTVVSWGGRNKLLHAGWLRTQGSVSSRFRRLDVGDQGVGRVTFCVAPSHLPSCCWWLSILGVPRLAAANPASLCPPLAFSRSLCFHTAFSTDRDQGPPFSNTNSSCLDFICNDPVSK